MHRWKWVTGGATPADLFVEHTLKHPPFNPSSSLYVARPQAGGHRFYATGYLDEVRITNGFARYKDNFIPPSAPFLNQ